MPDIPEPPILTKWIDSTSVKCDIPQSQLGMKWDALPLCMAASIGALTDARCQHVDN
jgi:hypothetical protein